MASTNAVESRRRPTRSVRLQLFVGFLTVLALVAIVLQWNNDDIVGTYHMQWYVLATVFSVTQACMVHLHFRRGAHSFSMSEVPLVLGLFFATPRGLLVAQLVGRAIVFAVQHRKSPIKAIFNLANLSVTAA